MQEILQTLGSEWAIRAMVTSTMVGITCGTIGAFIVLRNMSLIGDALSHSILPGIYFSFLIVGYSTLGFFIGSVIAGIITAVAITYIQQTFKTKNDAAIGIVFTAMFAIGVMGISRLNNTQGNHLDLKDFLFGNVLGISNTDIVLSGIVMIYTILCILLFYRYFFITTFQPTIAATMGISTKAVYYFLMLILSFAVVAALRSVGVILVVAMLITPASTALMFSNRLRRVLLISAITGAMSALIGFFLAVVFDTTPGPAMVIVATLIYIMAALFSPLKGLIPAWIRSRNQRVKIAREDILKYLHKNGSAADGKIAFDLGMQQNDVKTQLSILKNKGLVTKSSQPTLSSEGNIAAEDLIRAHRLWESYQSKNMGLNSEQIHEDAERLEHHMTPEFLDELDQKLGYPKTDPHGSPIPQGIGGIKLMDVKAGVDYTIAPNQENDHIEALLWELGLQANAIVRLIKKDKNNVWLESQQKRLRLNAATARRIKLESKVN
ncbi:MAG: metal ABC transporter permease [Saprospiraceae bacterium]|nr:metal ABC transporter permease [Saprospiraceae bacterium]